MAGTEYDFPAYFYKHWVTIHVTYKVDAPLTSLVTSSPRLITVQIYSLSSHDCANVAVFSQLPSQGRIPLSPDLVPMPVLLVLGPLR